MTSPPPHSREGEGPTSGDDPGSAGDDVAPVADYSDLLSTFDDAGGLDDGEARELETGLVLTEDDEGDLEPLAGGAVLDIGELLSSALDAGLDDDVTEDVGPGGESPDGAFALLEDSSAEANREDESTEDDGEGAVEPLASLVDGDLPELDDADDAGRAPPEAFVLEAGSPFPEEDEDLPPPSELPWVALPVRQPGEGQHLVARSGRKVVSAGRRLLQQSEDEGSLTLVDSLPALVTSLASGPEGATLFYTTAAGHVFRVRSMGDAPSAERLAAWRDAVPSSPGGTALFVGGPTPSARPALLLLLEEDGILLESTDHGTTFRRVELGGRVLCLSSGTPPLCVVETPRGVRVMRSEVSGGFRVVADTFPIEAQGSRIVTDGDVVAVLSSRPGEGAHVSADGGATFRRVRGSRTATAITAGRLGGRPSAFTALYGTASGRATLAWTDATTGESLAVAHLSGEDDEDGDPFRITALAWDAPTETLWATAPRGIFRFRRAASA